MAAKVYITEAQDVGAGGQAGNRHYMPIIDMCPFGSTSQLENASSPITASGSHAESAAFSATTRIIRIKTDGGGPICFSIGTAAVATTSNAHMSANQTEYFFVKPGDVVSVIVSAA